MRSMTSAGRSMGGPCPGWTVESGSRQALQRVEFEQRTAALRVVAGVRLQQRVRADLEEEPVARDQHAARPLPQADVSGGVAGEMQDLQLERSEIQAVAPPRAVPQWPAAGPSPAPSGGLLVAVPAIPAPGKRAGRRPRRHAASGRFLRPRAT